MSQTQANTSNPTSPPSVSKPTPIVGHAFQFLKDPIALVARGAKEHGKIFTIQFGNRPVVVLLGPEYSEFFFKETGKTLSIRESYPFFQDMFTPDFSFMGDYDGYFRQRSLILPRFQGAALESYVDAMCYETEKLCQEQLGDEGTLNLNQMMGPLVMNIAAHAFFGYEFRTKLADEFFEHFREFAEGIDPVTPRNILRLLPKYARSQKAKKKLIDIFTKLINERRANPGQKSDFLQVLSEANYPDGTDVPMHIRVNWVLLLVWAGHETTAGQTCWTIVDILQNPSIIEAMRKEQDTLWEPGTRMTYESIKNFELCDWVLKEAERLHPIAYLLYRTAAQDFEIGGHHVKKGTMVMAAPCVSHRLADVFANPEQWDPYRYSPERSEIKGKPFALIGFGGGIHRCTGLNFAYIEMKIILSILFRYFDIELVSEHVPEMKGVASKWPDNPIIKYRRRKDVVVTDLNLYRTI